MGGAGQDEEVLHAWRRPAGSRPARRPVARAWRRLPVSRMALGKRRATVRATSWSPAERAASACGEGEDARRCGGRREGGATARVPDVGGSGSARGEGGSGDGGGRRSGGVGEGEESCAVNGNRKYSTAKKGG